jgi:hypothetical protein
MNNMFIFLDIDGVLNSHNTLSNGYCGIDKDKADLLNQIIDNDTKIVISSAWRYLVINNFMTLTGFENLLLTHGLNIHKKIHGITISDELIPKRSDQIKHYINKHSIDKYIVLDDLIINIENFYRVDKGLTKEDLKKIRKMIDSILIDNKRFKMSKVLVDELLNIGNRNTQN